MTRVLNISHHKCGTTSVYKAFEILAFKSHHGCNCIRAAAAARNN